MQPLDAAFRQANSLTQAGAYAEAERLYLDLASQKPEWAWHNLAALYVATHRFEEAEAAFRKALTAAPDQAVSSYGLGVHLLRLGRYGEAWPHVDARHRLPIAPRPPRVSFPPWRGEPLSGKRLVVFPDEGFGDQIQAFRFLAALAADGAQVTYVCPPPLTRLFSGYGVEILPARPDTEIPQGDYWVFAADVARWLSITLETLSGAPYLRSPPASGRGRGAVGVIARGNPRHANDAHRSLPPDAAARLEALGTSLAPEVTGARDFQDTADILAGLDLVISVDTAVVHLAGALGKPVWVLLPYVETDWRWLVERADSPWYATARLFRQPRAGDWSTVLDAVESALPGVRA